MQKLLHFHFTHKHTHIFTILHKLLMLPVSSSNYMPLTKYEVFWMVTVLCTVAKINDILEEWSLLMSEGGSSRILQNVSVCQPDHTANPRKQEMQIQNHYSSWGLYSELEISVAPPWRNWNWDTVLMSVHKWHLCTIQKWNLFSMQYINLVPRAYELPVKKICNNFKKHNKQASSSFTEYEHILYT